MTVNAQDSNRTINVAAMEEALTVIKDHPGLHHQGSYAIGDFALQYREKGVEGMTPLNFKAVAPGRIAHDCGTAACFAGWIGVLNAEKYGYEASLGGEVYVEKDKWRNIEEWGIHVSHLSDMVCGLTFEQSTILYAPCNTVDMLESMVKDLANTGDIRELEQYQKEDRANSAG